MLNKVFEETLYNDISGMTINEMLLKTVSSYGYAPENTPTGILK